MLRLRSAPLVCILFICLKGCWGGVVVNVTPTLEAMRGESVTLPCTFEDPPPQSKSIVEWFIEDSGSRKRVAFQSVSGGGGIDEGTALSGRVTIKPDFSLFIFPVEVGDERLYYCQVTAGAAGSGEASTKLSVFFPPEKPLVTGISEAHSVLDSAVSEAGKCISKNSYPEPRIIWYKDSNPLPEVKDSKEDFYMGISLAKEPSGLYTMTNTLFLRPQKKDKDSVFYCKVEYRMPKGLIEQKESDRFSLILHYPTKHVQFSLETMGPIKEGDDVKMKCEADGNPPPPYEFSFFDKQGKRVPKQGYDGVLTLPAVSRKDQGRYSCDALDFDAVDVELTRELNLSVHYLDPVTITPSGSAVIPLGESMEIRCQTKSSDTYTLQWKMGKTVLSKTGILLLKSVTFSNAGNYSCVSEVPSVPGLLAQGNVMLTVSGKPEIADPAQAKVPMLGDIVTLTCSAQGHPAPQFTWTPSGKESVTVQHNKAVSTVTLEANEAVLNGGVTCEAANEHGKDSKQFKVVIQNEKSYDSNKIDSNEANIADRQQDGPSGVVAAVVVCVLLLLLLVTSLYCLQKKGKLPCGKQDKKDIEDGEVKNNAGTGSKPDKAHEEAELLNKQPAAEQ